MNKSQETAKAYIKRNSFGRINEEETITTSNALKAIELARQEEQERIIQYLQNRIKQLNDADILFCKDRWNMSKPDFERAIYREESNKVTFARQELQQVLKLFNPYDTSSNIKYGRESGYCIESGAGVIQHGTYSDLPERSIELYLDMYEKSTGDKLDWDHFQKEGDKVVKVSLVKEQKGESVKVDSEVKEKGA
jgi:hypothetical protein